MASIRFLLLFILFASSTFSSCQNDNNPCLNRIDYSNNDINSGIDLALLFEKPSDIEISTILESWSSFNTKSDNHQLIDSYEIYTDRIIEIYEHTTEGRKHYGAIMLPLDYSKTVSYSMMVWADGLNQNNPLNDVQNGYGVGIGKALPNHFVVIPSFRGQSLKTKNGIYCSDGFFGDAYDGATDDALRLMELALEKYNTTINTSDITIYGGSRGGTVALLAGIRDHRITKVVSQSGPSQFHHRWCHDHYGFQFRYQFLNKKQSLAEHRNKLLKCSPIYFIDQLQSELLIVHGKNDPVVPIWNATNIISSFETDSIDHILTDDQHFVSAGDQIIDWIK